MVRKVIVAIALFVAEHGKIKCKRVVFRKAYLIGGDVFFEDREGVGDLLVLGRVV